MASTIAPLSYAAPIGRTGGGDLVYGERAFLDYIAQQVFQRIGGASAPTNAELDAGSAAVQVLALGAHAQADQRAAVHALERRVAELEAQVLALLRARIDDRGLADVQTITFGAR